MHLAPGEVIEVETSSDAVDDEDPKLVANADEAPSTPCRVGVGNLLFVLLVSIPALTDFLIPFTSNPVIADLLVDFAIVPDTSESAFYSGYVSVAHYLGQAFASMLLCSLASKLGHRHVLIVSQAFATIIVLLLAFVNNYYYYVVMRLVYGLCVASFPVALAAVGARGMSSTWNTIGFSIVNALVNVSFGVGSLLGGSLGRPVQQFGWFAGTPFGDFLITFPMFFVYIVVGILNAVVLVVLFIFLRTGEARGGDGENEREVRVMDVNPFAGMIIDFSSKSAPEVAEVRPFGEEEGGQSQSASKSAIARCCRSVCGSGLCARLPLTVLFLWTLVRCATMLTTFTIPVLLSIDADQGGFGLKNYEVGIYGWVDAAFSVVFSMLTTPFLKFLNIVWLLRTTPYAYLVFFVLYPELRHIKSRTGLWAALVSITCVRQALRQTVFTILLLMVNNCVRKKTKEIMQGVSGFVGYVGAAAGPYIGNALLGVGLRTHLSLFVAALCCIVIGLMSICLPLSLHRPLPEEDDPLEEGEGDGGEEGDDPLPEEEEEKLDLAQSEEP